MTEVEVQQEAQADSVADGQDRKKAKRSWAKRLFPVLVLVLGVFAGVALFYYNQARIQRSAVRQLEARGAKVTYEPGLAPGWLRGWLPRDFTDRVVTVTLVDSDTRDISSIAVLPHIRKLWLVATGVYDITAVSRLWELEELVIDSSPVRDLSPLGELARLRVLRFNDTKVRDLTPLSKLRLEQLWFSGTPVHRLEPLAAMDSLQSIVISHTRIRDLKPIAELTEMVTIKMDHSNVNDLRPLEKMKKLSNVSFRGLPILPSQVARLDVNLPNWECKAFQDPRRN